MPTSVTLAAVTPMLAPLQHCHLIQPILVCLLTCLLYKLTLLLPATHPMKRKTKGVGSHLPFGPQTWWPSVSSASLLGIVQPHAKPLSLTTRNAPYLSNGEEANSSPRMPSRSACFSMSVATAMESSLPFTVNISAPCAEMLTMACAPAHTIELHRILYINVTPYIPGAWKQALADAYLTSSFPNLVHNNTFGSPIGNSPPLLHTFIPKSLVSATFLPDIIEKELLNETASGCMSGPFSIEEAQIIFNGHFWTYPVGLVEKVLGDGNWQMIRHLLKTDHLGFSTNDTLDSNDFSTLFFSAAHVTKLVCISYFNSIACSFSCLLAA